LHNRTGYEFSVISSNGISQAEIRHTAECLHIYRIKRTTINTVDKSQTTECTHASGPRPDTVAPDGERDGGGGGGTVQEGEALGDSAVVDVVEG
jgi:hypothetical protein